MYACLNGMVLRTIPRCFLFSTYLRNGRPGWGAANLDVFMMDCEYRLLLVAKQK